MASLGSLDVAAEAELSRIGVLSAAIIGASPALALLTGVKVSLR